MAHRKLERGRELPLNEPPSKAGLTSSLKKMLPVSKGVSLDRLRLLVWLMRGVLAGVPDSWSNHGVHV